MVAEKSVASTMLDHDCLCLNEVAEWHLWFVLSRRKKTARTFSTMNLRSIDAKNVDVVGLSDGASSTSESRINQ